METQKSFFNVIVAAVVVGKLPNEKEKQEKRFCNFTFTQLTDTFVLLRITFFSKNEK